MRPNNDRGRPVREAASNVSVGDGDRTIVGQALESLPHMTRRLLQEALSAAWRPQQLNRAAQWRAAAPRPGDFIGRQQTPEGLRDAWRRCHAIARAFERRAELCPSELIAADVDTVLEEVA